MKQSEKKRERQTGRQTDREREREREKQREREKERKRERDPLCRVKLRRQLLRGETCGEPPPRVLLTPESASLFRCRSDWRFQVLDLSWHSPEFSEFW